MCGCGVCSHVCECVSFCLQIRMCMEKSDFVSQSRFEAIEMDRTNLFIHWNPIFDTKAFVFDQTVHRTHFWFCGMNFFGQMNFGQGQCQF